jgi:hypothetical protein
LPGAAVSFPVVGSLPSASIVVAAEEPIRGMVRGRRMRMSRVTEDALATIREVAVGMLEPSSAIHPIDLPMRGPNRAHRELEPASRSSSPRAPAEGEDRHLERPPKPSPQRPRNELPMTPLRSLFLPSILILIPTLRGGDSGSRRGVIGGMIIPLDRHG